ncbi:MAG: histidine phosphatase family protein [Lachnospiraceae bacterium]|nr:histidine phosphatase family protein [Lachnospiraceae bacterium]
MRLLIVRHGEPNYEKDILTEKGQREAQLLVPHLIKENIKDFYVSPLGRARETAAPTLKALGREAVTLDWLQEVTSRLDLNEHPEMEKWFPDTNRLEDGSYEKRITWDMLPEGWKNDPLYYDPVRWRETPLARLTDVAEQYDVVTKGMDELLASYGYVRDGQIFRTEQGNNDTIALFCHFGLTSQLLAYFWNVSPLMTIHNLVTVTSSVTEIVSEERVKGIATFRTKRVGDTGHLREGGEPESFFARFCESYENDWERH